MTKKKKILLLGCPEQIPKKAVPRAYVPLGIAYIAATLLEHGYETEIFDPVIEGIETRLDVTEKMQRVGAAEDEIKRVIARFKPDVVGISTIFTGDGPQVHRLAELAKSVSPEIITVVGGYYPFTMAERCLKDTNVDYIVMGEGEFVMIAFMDYLNGKGAFPENVFNRSNCRNIIPGSYPVVREVSRLPMPARHLLPMPKYFKFMSEMEPYKPLNDPCTSILATRGCPLVCTFCARTSQLSHDYEKRTIENVRAEIEHLVSTYGVRELFFVDDNLILSPKFTNALVDMLSEFKLSWYMFAGTWTNTLTPELLDRMKASGLYRLRFNLESANPETLKIMQKPVKLDRALEMARYAKSIGLLTQGIFMIGYPHETLSSIERMLDWIGEADFDYTTFAVATPYPGTTLYKQVKEMGYLIGDTDEDQFEMYLGRGRIRTPHFAPEDIERLRFDLWRRMNFSSPEKLQRANRVLNPRVSGLNAPLSPILTGDGN